MKVVIKGIYLLTNIKTGRKYIGSSVNIQRRKESYRRGYGLPASMRCDGVVCSDISFEIVAIRYDISRHDLLRMELAYILKYNTVYPLGYNISNPVTAKPLSMDQGYIKPTVRPIKKAIYKHDEPNSTGIKVWPGVPLNHIIFCNRLSEVFQ